MQTEASSCRKNPNLAGQSRRRNRSRNPSHKTLPRRRPPKPHLTARSSRWSSTNTGAEGCARLLPARNNTGVSLPQTGGQFAASDPSQLAQVASGLHEQQPNLLGRLLGGGGGASSMLGN